MRSLRLLIAAAIVTASPGLLPYRTWAATFSAVAGKGNVSPASRIGLRGPGSSAGPAFLGTSGLKTLGLTSSLAVPEGPGPVVRRFDTAAEGVSAISLPAEPSRTIPIRTRSELAGETPASPLESLSSEKIPAARVSLEAMEMEGSSGPNDSIPVSDAKIRQDRLWEGSSQEKELGAVTPAAKRGSPGGPATPPLGPAKGTKTSTRFFAAVPLAAVSAAAEGSPAWLNVLSTLPSWAVTTLEVGGILGGTFLLSLLVRWGAKRLFKHTDWKPLLESWLARTAGRLVWLAGIGWALAQVGVSLQAIAASAGIAGIALGLAVKDVASNLFSGLKLWWNVWIQGRPFRIGDQIEADGEEGRVKSVSTRFVTLDLTENESSEYESVLIPNERLLNKLIKNKTGTFMGAALLGGWMAPWTPWMVVAGKFAGVLAGSWALSRIFRALARRALKSRLSGRGKAEEAKLQWLANMAGHSAYLIGGAILLNLLGLSLSWLVTSVGVSAAILALASKDLASNAVSGLMLAVYRPFGFGDTIKAAGAQGKVVDITQDFVTLELEGDSQYRFAHIPLSKLLKEKIYIGKKP